MFDDDMSAQQVRLTAMQFAVDWLGKQGTLYPMPTVIGVARQVEAYLSGEPAEEQEVTR